MASLPWVPWPPTTNHTEILSPAQIERIVQLHRESRQNAIIYVLVVLAIYFVALAVLVGRYLQHERDISVAVCVSQILERTMATYRRVAGQTADQNGAAGMDAASPSPVPTVTGDPRKLSLKFTWAGPAPPMIKYTPQPRPQRPPRPRAPQTDDESSESTSPPYSPTAHTGAEHFEMPSSSDEEAAPAPVTASVTALRSEHGLQQAGRVSPAVVSVLICDLQDTQV